MSTKQNLNSPAIIEDNYNTSSILQKLVISGKELSVYPTF